MRKMVIAVDFDGVINASPYPEVGVVVNGARDAMQELKRRGHHLIIWTCREGQDQTDAINFLLEKGIPFDNINCNARENFERYSNDCRKVPTSTLMIVTSVASPAGRRL
ncbi:hypothetical protein QYZ87_10915 [Porphyromonadaceae bacterium W3.11]|nr:hypothetical protein [Porphyromonadaceae bacterium W3.11]